MNLDKIKTLYLVRILLLYSLIPKYTNAEMSEFNSDPGQVPQILHKLSKKMNYSIAGCFVFLVLLFIEYLISKNKNNETSQEKAVKIKNWIIVDVIVLVLILTIKILIEIFV